MATNTSNSEHKTSYAAAEAVTDAVEHSPATREEVRDQKMRYEATDFALRNQNGLLSEQDAARYAMAIGTENRLPLEDVREFRVLLTEGHLTGDKAASFERMLDSMSGEAKQQLDGTEIDPAVRANAGEKLDETVHHIKVGHVEEYRQEAIQTEATDFASSALAGEADRAQALEILQDTTNHTRLDSSERERLQGLSAQTSFTRDEQVEFMALNDKTYQAFMEQTEETLTIGERAAVNAALKAALMEEAVRCSPNPPTHTVNIPDEYWMAVSSYAQEQMDQLGAKTDENAHMNYANGVYQMTADITEFGKGGERPDWITDEMIITPEQKAMGHDPHFRPIIYDDADATAENVRSAAEAYRDRLHTEDDSAIYRQAMVQFIDKDLDEAHQRHETFNNPMVLEYVAVMDNTTERHGELHYAQQVKDWTAAVQEGQGEGLAMAGEKLKEDAAFIRGAIDADKAGENGPDAKVEGYSGVFDTRNEEEGVHWNHVAELTQDLTNPIPFREQLEADLTALDAYIDQTGAEELQTAEDRAIMKAWNELDVAVQFLTRGTDEVDPDTWNPPDGHYSAAMLLATHADWLIRHASHEADESQETGVEEEEERKGFLTRLKERFTGVD